MRNDESIASFFLHIDDIVNRMENLGEEINDTTLVEKILRFITPKFESKVSTIEEKQDLQAITSLNLNGTSFEMRKGGPSGFIETSFKASSKGREKEEHKESRYISKEDEVNFVKKLQLGTRKFLVKLPFKCFACGRVGHYATKFPHKDNHDKVKDTAKR